MSFLYVLILIAVIARVLFVTYQKNAFRNFDYECYFDKEGRYVPLSQEGSCNVIIANGHIKEQLSANCASFDAKKMSEDSKLQEMDIIQLWILAEFLYSHEEYGP